MCIVEPGCHIFRWTLLYWKMSNNIQLLYHIEFKKCFFPSMESQGMVFVWVLMTKERTMYVIFSAIVFLSTQLFLTEMRLGHGSQETIESRWYNCAKFIPNGIHWQKNLMANKFDWLYLPHHPVPFKVFFLPTLGSFTYSVSKFFLCNIIFLSQCLMWSRITMLKLNQYFWKPLQIV